MNRQQTIDELRRLADTLEALPDDTDAGCQYHNHLHMHMQGVDETQGGITRLGTVLDLSERRTYVDSDGLVTLCRPYCPEDRGSISLYCREHQPARSADPSSWAPLPI